MENRNIPVVLSAPTTKTDIESAARHAIDIVNEGEISAVEAYIKLKALQSYCEQVEKGIKQAFYSEVERTLDVKHDRPMGATLKETTTAAKFDYSASEQWQKQKVILELAKTDLAAIEQRMKVTGEAVMVGGGDVIYSVTLSK